ncbi:MAG: hypothetical protein KDA54_08310 [Phycisphaerales bacterium]|nr:hypothetical protein [Phycisphaerales bacterium]
MQAKRKPWLVISVAILVAGTVATFFFVRNLNHKWEAIALWEACRDELIAKGEPLTLSEIEARRPLVPDNENGSLVIENFAAELQDLNSNATEPIPIFNVELRRIDPYAGIPPGSVEPMRSFLAENDRLISDLSLLNANSNGRLTIVSYDFEGDDPSEFAMPSLAPWNIAGKLMRLRSISQLIDGDTDGGVESIVTQFGIAATMRHEPNFIPYNIRLRIIRDAISVFEAALRTDKLEPHHLDRISEKIRKQAATISPAEVMRIERAFLILLYESLAAKKIDVVAAFADQDIPDAVAISEYDIRIAQVRAVSYFPNRIAAAHDPEQLLSARKDRSFTRKYLSIDENKRWLYRNILPDSYFCVLAARTHALLRCALTGIAAERFRMDRKRFPRTLDELVPTYIDAIPNDPFTRKPLSLAKTDHGIVIYSFGIDEEDDGGKLKAPEGEYGSPDIGFRLASPEHRGSLVASPSL